jgi:hypothetical protein
VPPGSSQKLPQKTRWTITVPPTLEDPGAFGSKPRNPAHVAWISATRRMVPGCCRDVVSGWHSSLFMDIDSYRFVIKTSSITHQRPAPLVGETQHARSQRRRDAVPMFDGVPLDAKSSGFRNRPSNAALGMSRKIRHIVREIETSMILKLRHDNCLIRPARGAPRIRRYRMPACRNGSVISPGCCPRRSHAGHPSEKEFENP